MANVSSVLKHFVTAKEGFSTATSGTVASGAATVGLNSVAGYSNGDVVTLVIEPTSSTNKQVFTGTIDTAGVQVTGVVWTEGTNVGHAAGSTVVDYETATAWAMYSRGLLRDHNHSGYHKTLNDDNGNEWIKQSSTASAVNEVTIANAATGTNPVISATGGDTNIGLTLTPKGTGSIVHTLRHDGWTTGLPTPNTVTANGNRNYSLVFNSTDLTSYISNGMRLKLTRTVTAPTQCTDLESGSSQYYSKSSPSGMTFTDDFVVSAWVKLESYGAVQSIASRYNGTSGWDFTIQANGQVLIAGYNGGAANVSYLNSYASIPLNKWVHVAAQLDMSAFTATTTTSYIMIDGLDVAATVTRGGTNPTALIQAGNLEVGGRNGGLQPFDGKLAQVAIYSAKVTQATVLASMHQTLSGSETSLISAYSFNNTINDLNTSNANNLTANGSAVATNADSPFAGGADASTAHTAGTTEFGIVQAVTFSTNTTLNVQVAAGYAIPTSGGVSAVAYSVQKTPLGFPSNEGLWAIEMISKTSASQNSPVNGTWYNLNSLKLTLPIGAHKVYVEATTNYLGAGGASDMYASVSTSASAESDTRFTKRIYIGSNTNTFSEYSSFHPISVTAQTDHYLITKTGSNTMTTIAFVGDVGCTILRATNAYV